ncbi:Chitin deacetylase-like 9 [Carabus blaptoides fortunei]
MKTISLLALICVASALALPTPEERQLERCTADKCVLPDCQCAVSKKPNATSLPQLVLLSFNDAVGDLIYDNMWSKFLFDSKNPDGCAISATFFVPHQYTSYQVVNKLYNKGFEIASHSITKNVLADYWQKASVDVIMKEMGGQRDFLSKYANIPSDKIIGARIPLLQLNENTFEGLQKAGLKYDASWPTMQNLPLFPYTLDYKSPQMCPTNPVCQKNPVKGFWEIPIIDQLRQDNIPCNSLLGCGTTGTADEIFEWMKTNFETHYKAHRAPFSFIIDYAWFVAPEEHQEALHKFLNYLKEQKDVYIVSYDKALEWAQNPTAEFNSCREYEKTDCNYTPYPNCKWIVDGIEKYMAEFLAAPKSEKKELEICTADNCKLPDCQCAVTEIPDTKNRPQLVMLSFNDAVTDMIYNNMWAKLPLDSKNPDGCPISATLFVTHQYTNYQIVNKLYNKGFEIASNSITKNALLEYWQKADVDTIAKEMGGQRDFIAEFANIPTSAITGSRIPFFSLNENTFEGLQKTGLKYDATLQIGKPYFPFTLDYKTPLTCNSDKCQVKGFWELPLIAIVRKDGIPCNSLLACAVEGSADEIFEWLKENFENHYNMQKAPFNLMVDYAWYVASDEHPLALHKFMEHLKTLDDVYIVSFDKVLEWAKNPTDKFNSCREFEVTNCEFTSYPNCNIPQFVVLSIDDAATADIYDAFISKQFIHRKNPDGCSISGTYFVPHEYTNYATVNTLYNHGFEIASHSVSKNFLQTYWDEISVEGTIEEMDGQRTIISTFANIPVKSIVGARIPQLRLNKNTFEALQKAGFEYDSSWPTLKQQPYFPYSLDYASTQQCHSIQCQSKSTPGLWEVPINDWVNQEGTACNSIEACATRGTEGEIYEWMKTNFNAYYKNKQSPFHLRVSYAWYVAQPENSGALEKFLDYLDGLKDVYIVSTKQLLDWSKNPSEKFSSCQKITSQSCSSLHCTYDVNGLQRIMFACDECPENYPSLSNLHGL